MELVLIIRPESEIKAAAKRMTDAYTAGYQDRYDGRPEAKQPSRHEQEAYRMGSKRCADEMRVEQERIG